METNLNEFDIDKHLKELQQEYLQELPGKIDDIDNLIIGLEDSDDPGSAMRNIAGMIHTIKGTAGSYDMNFASTLCHNFEDYIAALQVAKTQFNTEIDNFLKFTGLLREYIDSCLLGGYQDFDQFNKKLSELVSGYAKTKHRILIVEPAKSMSYRYLKALKKFNVEASFAKDGYDALGRLVKEKFDSMITVAQMEWIKGLQLIASLRIIESDNQNIPVVLITSDSEIKLAGQHGHAYLLKKRPEMLNDLEEIYTGIIEKKDVPQKTETLPIEQTASPAVKRQLQKILYIDDDKDLQPLVKIGLKKLDPPVDLKCYTSPKSALKDIEEINPDLILSDVMMPEMDGPAVLKTLREGETFKTTPFIFLTGHESEEDKQALIELGASGVISKPINPKKLAAAVQDIWAGIV